MQIFCWAKRCTLAALFVALAMASTCAYAQTDDRLAVAKSKGRVSWYAAIFPDELRLELTDRFEKKTGIAVNTYIGGTGQVFSRFVTERQAGSHNVDVLTISDTDLIADLVKDHALVPYHGSPSPTVDSTYRDPADYWQTIAFWACSLEYNIELVKPQSVPKTWDVLVDPAWKSKIAINDPARSALGFLLLKAMVNEHGWDWIDKLMHNDPLVIAVGPGVDQAVVKGERALGTVVSAYASETMKAGGPIGIATDEALFVSLMTASVVAGAPNPEGAQLLIDYLLSPEAGQLYVKYGWFSPRSDVPGPYGFPPANKLKIRNATVPSPKSRQDMLNRFNSIAQATRQ